MRTGDPDEADLFDQHTVDVRMERDDEHEPRPARRHTVSLERQRNQARFADILGASAYQEWLARNWSSVLGANLYKAAQFASRGIGARS